MGQYSDFYVQPMSVYYGSSNARFINLRLCPKESHDTEKTFSKPNSSNHSACLGELFGLFHEIPFWNEDYSKKIIHYLKKNHLDLVKQNQKKKNFMQLFKHHSRCTKRKKCQHHNLSMMAAISCDDHPR